MNEMKTLPFKVENETEQVMVLHPDFAAGLWYGKPRDGHPEGAVAYHIRDVLSNIDDIAARDSLSPERRYTLRLIALAHDTFKHKVDRTRPKQGPNHHGAIAAAFMRRLGIAELACIVTEHHDDAYNAWASAGRFGKPWDHAERRALVLMDAVRDHLHLYLQFFEADNGTEGKTREPFLWFQSLAVREGRIS
jgi:hypothetical protein